MKKLQKKIAFGMLNLMLLNSFPLGALGDTGKSSVLIQDIKLLDSGIDSGTVKPAAAVDTFTQAIVDQNISMEDVNVFVKTQMTDRQYAGFQDRVTAELRGIDTATLTPAETGEIVGRALSDIHTEGLYWSGCASVWTGAAVIAAAVVLGVIGILKSKSTASIQAGYDRQVSDTQYLYTTNIANTKASYNQQITATNNWKTAFPAEITSDNNGIQSANADIATQNAALSNAQWDLSQATTPYQTQIAQDEISSIQTNLSNDENVISGDASQISSLTQKIAEYNQNPALSAQDAATLATQRDAAIAAFNAQEPIDIASIQSKEAAALAAAPGNQSLGEKLGIGAGIGAAIGAGLMIYGFHEGASCGN